MHAANEEVQPKVLGIVPLTLKLPASEPPARELCTKHKIRDQNYNGESWSS